MDANHKNLPKPVYGESPTFQMAVLQLLSVAELIELDQNILERLSKPKRAHGRQRADPHGRRPDRRPSSATACSTA